MLDWDYRFAWVVVVACWVCWCFYCWGVRLRLSILLVFTALTTNPPSSFSWHIKLLARQPTKGPHLICCGMNYMASSCIGRFILAWFLLVPFLTFASHHHHLRVKFTLTTFFFSFYLSFLSSHIHFSFCLWTLLCAEETRLLQEIHVKDMKARTFPHYVSSYVFHCHLFLLAFYLPFLYVCPLLHFCPLPHVHYM